jgi:hypothetical protein
MDLEVDSTLWHVTFWAGDLLGVVMTLTQLQQVEGWDALEHLTIMHEVLGSIPSTAK